MKIVTLTLNPAFDVHCDCDNFRPYHESVAKITEKDAGGKGVNISRALSVNGVDNLAVVVVGKENGLEFCRRLEGDGLSVSAVWVDGRIRENITLHEKNNPETRISFEGFSCESDVLREIEKRIGEVNGRTIVTFTGSIPKGVQTSAVLVLLEKFRNEGAKIVIDSRSVALDELIAFKPWLIKPNKDEAEAYIGRKIESEKDAVLIAEELYENGVENVMISLGADGAVLVSKEGVLLARPPKISVNSTIGAGDSTLAGFIDGVVKGLETRGILKRAVAFGTAACMQKGTLPPSPDDVKAIEEKIEIS